MKYKNLFLCVAFLLVGCDSYFEKLDPKLEDLCVKLFEEKRSNCSQRDEGNKCIWLDRFSEEVNAPKIDAERTDEYFKKLKQSKIPMKMYGTNYEISLWLSKLFKDFQNTRIYKGIVETGSVRAHNKKEVYCKITKEGSKLNLGISFIDLPEDEEEYKERGEYFHNVRDERRFLMSDLLGFIWEYNIGKVQVNAADYQFTAPGISPELNEKYGEEQYYIAPNPNKTPYTEWLKNKYPYLMCVDKGMTGISLDDCITYTSNQIKSQNIKELNVDKICPEEYFAQYVFQMRGKNSRNYTPQEWEQFQRGKNRAHILHGDKTWIIFDHKDKYLVKEVFVSEICQKIYFEGAHPDKIYKGLEYSPMGNEAFIFDIAD